MLDAAGWLARWDAQQERYIPAREQRYAAMTELLAIELGSGAGAVVLDLGCGPGSTTDRVLRALPEVRVVAVDLDPVLIELARRTAVDPDRVTHVEADLRGAEWSAQVNPPEGGFAAVVSTTALHWLDTASLRTLYRTVRGLLRPGGWLLNGDHLRFGDDQPTVRRVVGALRSRDDKHAFAGDAEDYAAWHAALRAAAPVLPWTERERRFADRPREDLATTLTAHVEALQAAGFAEVATVWQRRDDRVLAAVAPS